MTPSVARARSNRALGLVLCGVALAAARSAACAGDWLSYGLDHSEQRFSSLAHLNPGNVKRLGLIWHFDVPDARSLVATPLVKSGVIYFSANDSRVYAVEARRGRLRWRYDPQVGAAFSVKRPDRQRMAWGTNRGLAMWGDSLYVGTADGRLIALDMRTGRERWAVQSTDPDTPGAITGAPRAFRGTIYIGCGGADNGPIRGYVAAYDARSGRQKWRFYTVPGNPADGFENDAMRLAARTWTGEWWKHGGGGTVWNSITIDEDLGRVYIGTGNGAPWNRRIRSPGGGDNLFLSSIVALDADSGAYRWHYQTTPGETWDYNSAQDIVLADLTLDGVRRKVILHAPKNGFFYVIDRLTGRLISADKIGKVTWAGHIDPGSGRPVENSGSRYESGETLIWPGPPGVHNWQPMSFNSDLGLVYIPTIEVPGYYNDRGIDTRRWRHASNTRAEGLNLLIGDLPRDTGNSSLLAWDPIGRRAAWRVPTAGAWPGGTLSTKGGLVFQGQADGRLLAFDARSGAILWQFDAKYGITAPPVTYRVDGDQYVSVLVGWGGGGPLVGGSLFAQHGWDYRAEGCCRLLTFALDGRLNLPASTSHRLTPLIVAGFESDAELVRQGERLYARFCQTCHGHDAISGGSTPDLRASALAASAASLRTIVIAGALQQRGMPQFAELTETDIEQLFHYIRDRAAAKAPSPPAVLSLDQAP